MMYLMRYLYMHLLILFILVLSSEDSAFGADVGIYEEFVETLRKGSSPVDEENGGTTVEGSGSKVKMGNMRDILSSSLPSSVTSPFPSVTPHSASSSAS